jgi:hypothetical protein
VADDKDKPQITQPSNSNEPPAGKPSSMNPLDIRSVSPLATGTGPLGPSDPVSVPSWDGLSPPPTELPADALSILAASAATGQRAYDAVQDAKRKAGGISRAPPPPPSLLGNNYGPKPSEHPPHRDESLRGDLTRAVEEQEARQQPPPMPPHGNGHAKFNTADIVVLLFANLLQFHSVTLDGMRS